MKFEMRNRDVVQYTVKGILFDIEQAGGIFSAKMATNMLQEYKGGYAPLALNIICAILDKKPLCTIAQGSPNFCNEKEFSWLVEEAAKKNDYAIQRIKKLREAREAAKVQKGEKQPMSNSTSGEQTQECEHEHTTWKETRDEEATTTFREEACDACGEIVTTIIDMD